MASFHLIRLLPMLLVTTVNAAGSNELQTFVVHVQPPENHLFSTANERTLWYKSFLPEDGRLVHSYHHVASGFAARLTQQELDEVSVKSGFVAAVPNHIYKLLTTHTPEFLGLDLPQPGQNYSSGFGEGVIIGVLDTGVVPDHPSFAGSGMPPPPTRWKGRCNFHGSSACNNKLIGARDLTTPNVTNAPPVDDNGHGTHTASTAAGAVVPGAQVLGQGLGTASGISPRAHVAIYKVCGSNGGCFSANILAGIDEAVGNGCDVISMSLGGASRQFYQDNIAIGTFGAIEKGVFVSMSAGNAGPSPRTLSKEAPWMLIVAASTMDRQISAQVHLGNGLSFDGESVYQPSISTTVSYPLVYAGASATPNASYCGQGSLDDLDVKGKIVLCDSGKIRDVDKGAEVKRAGGFGMILGNGFRNGYTTIADAHVLPASYVSYAAGAEINKYIKSTANPVAQILFKGTVLGTKPAPAMAYFSSRGPSLQDRGILKPDITGPGVNVLAAWPFVVGPPTAKFLRDSPNFHFNIISGTSMSAPHLSGIAALIRSRHPGWSPAAIKSAIMTTADATDRSGNPIVDEQHLPANLFATGAGHVNPDKAMDPGLVYDIDPSDYVSYLCGLYSSLNVSVITRRRVDCSTVTVIPDRLLNYPSISVTLPSTAPVVVSRTVKNVGAAQAVYYPKVNLPGAVQVVVTPSSLQFTAVNQVRNFTVSVTRGQSTATTVVQGSLQWISDKHTVRSPVSISFV